MPTLDNHGSAPPYNGTLARYDTQAAGGFTSGASWGTLDMNTLEPGADDFLAAAFDGRFLYLSAVGDNTASSAGILARFDTNAGGGFDSASAWSLFNTRNVMAGAWGFRGAAFDGRYVYFVPDGNGGPDGIAARYDTRGPGGLDATASWETVDLRTFDNALAGFNGAAFDGRYVYFVPNANWISGFNYDGVVARYDTRACAGFTGASSWSTFDVTSVNPLAQGFAGATFDGRYLYLVTLVNAPPDGGSPGQNYDGVVARYDTQASGGFGASGSWSTFDVSSVNPGAKGFVGAAFDGRFVYLVPWHDANGYDGILARFDTLAAGGFAAVASGSTFDVTRVNAGAQGFSGAVFDGRFLYLVPNAANGLADGLVARFDTRACGMPVLPGWFPWGPGSFF